MATPFDVNYAPFAAPDGTQPNLGLNDNSTLDQLVAGLRANTPSRGSSVYFSPSQNSYSVGGKTISARDEAALLSTGSSTDFNVGTPSPGGDYQPVDVTSFLGVLDKIANPDFGTRLAKNVESGIAGQGVLLGAGLKFLGLDGVGDPILNASQTREDQLAPYSMGLEDISGARNHGPLDWFAGIVGQFGPTVLVSALSAGFGAAAGAVSGGTAAADALTGIGGALVRHAGKEAVQRNLEVAAKKYIAKEALTPAETQLLRSSAGQFAAALEKNPTFAQQLTTAFGDTLTPSSGALITPEATANIAGLNNKLQTIMKAAQSQRVAAGAALGTAANSLATGVSDTYREQLQSGDPNAPNRAAALALGIPYAAMDFLPEYVLARRILGNVGADAAKKLVESNTIRGKAATLLKRGIKGGVIGGALEGGNEAFQEMMLIAANPLVDFNSPEGISRILNAFAGGAAVGAPIGSFANLADNEKPVDILNPTKNNVTTPDGPDNSPTGGNGSPTGLLPGPGYGQFSEINAPTAIGVDQRGLNPYVGPENVGDSPYPPGPVGRQDVPYGEFTDILGQNQLALPPPSEPTAPAQIGQQRLLTGPQQRPAPSPVTVLRRGTPVAPANLPGQAFTAGQMVPASRPGRAFGTEQMTPTLPPDANGQGRLPLFGGKALKRVVNTTEQAPVADTLGANDPTLQPDLFNDRFPLLETPASASPIKARNIRMKNNIISWLNSLTDQEMQMLAPAYGGSQDSVLKAATKTTSPAKTLAEMKSALANVKATQKVVAKREGKVVKLKVEPKPIPPEEPPKPTNPGGAKLKKQSTANSAPSGAEKLKAANAANAAKAAARKASETKMSRDEWLAEYESLIREADVGEISPLVNLHHFANAKEDDNIPSFITEAAKRYFRDTTFSAKQQAKIKELDGGVVEAPKTIKPVSAAEKLMDALTDLATNPGVLQDLTSRTVAISKINALYQNAIAANPNGKRGVDGMAFNGKTVGDLFTAGKLNVQQVTTEEGPEYRLADDLDTGTGRAFAVADDAPVNISSDKGRIKMAAQAILSKLHVKPKLHVFRNMDDFRRTDPELYNKAKAARRGRGLKQGQAFEEVKAAGYSFSGTVILFADHIRTDQQLRFILAHETLGHFGFRSIMSESQLNSVLDTIYNTSSTVKAKVDQMVEARGLSRREATEEYVADYAASIDTNIIKKIWDALKNALNKLGLHFDDDAARLLVAQSRRYVRDGNTGFFSARSLMDQMNDMQSEAEDGRFAVDDTSLGSNWAAQSKVSDLILRPYEDITEFWKAERMRENAEGFKADFMGMLRRGVEQVQTLNNIALRSEGLSIIFRMMQQQAALAHRYISDVTMKMHTINGVEFKDGKRKIIRGLTTEHRLKAAKLNNYASIVRMKQANDIKLDGYDNLIKMVDGEPQIDEAALARIAKDGFVTAEEFKRGLSWKDSTGGEQTFNPLKEGFTEDDFKPDSLVWRMYLESRDAINHAAARTAAANYTQALLEKRYAREKITSMYTVNPLSEADKEILNQIADAFASLRMEGAEITGASVKMDPKAMENAESFLINVTTALVKTADGKENDTLRQWLEKGDTEYTKAEWKTKFPEIVKGLRPLAEKGVSDTTRKKIQALLRNIAIQDGQVTDAERYAKKTILGSYTPLKRRGRFEIKIRAEDKFGRKVRLNDQARGVMFYARTDSEAEAKQYVKHLQEIFEAGKEYELQDQDGNDITVTLRPVYATARTAADFEDIVNLNEFVYVAERFGIQFTPETRERVITGLTAANESARSRLTRDVSPGWDRDGLRSIAEYLETQSHVAAKRIFQLRIHDTLQNSKLWTGDKARLNRLKAAIDSATTDGERARARRQYNEYAYKYSQMAEGDTVEIGGKQIATRGLGKEYLDKAHQLVDWLASQTNVQDSTEDGLQGPLMSRLKTGIIAMQLGGTIATAAVNTVSMVTHSIPYLAFYNAKEGFGLGHGFGRAAKAMSDAVAALKAPSLGDYERMNTALRDGKYGKLTKDELEFLIEETEGGILQAAMPDALLGTARGKINNPLFKDAYQKYMGFFTYTERLNRRVTALAAYRLEKERALAEGLNEDRAVSSAKRVARDAVTNTQGEYGMINRPRMARGNLFSLVFVYKMFPILTVQLIKHMPIQGKLWMLGSMFLLAGMKGLPFADDIMDVIDTILQWLGIKAAPVEAQLYEALDGATGGHGREFMRGWLDQFSGATFSTRFSSGDIIPLTGVFKAGADVGREMTNFLGPMAGGLFGSVNTAAQMFQSAKSVVTGDDRGMSFVDIMRQSPVALARALGDTLVYADTGAVVNSRGQVISKDMNAWTLFTRMVGFYPASATTANDFTRIGKQQRDYMAAISASFKNAYIKAAMANNGRGDQAKMRDVIDSVRDWNEAAKGTGFEIADFRSSMQKAIKAAKEPAGERFLKTTPLAMRDRTSEWLSIYGAE